MSGWYDTVVVKGAKHRVRVGTPGVGAGSFVAFGSEDVAANPLAEFEFPAARPGDAAKFHRLRSGVCEADKID